MDCEKSIYHNDDWNDAYRVVNDINVPRDAYFI